MLTLKPHLFAEMVAIFVEVFEKRRSRYWSYTWNFDSPSNICAFAMSSQHAYKIVAYLLKNFLTRITRYETTYLVFNHNSYGIHSLSFKMDERHHIRALMRIAGQFCTIAFDNERYTNLCDWQQPIFDGLSNNEVFSSDLALRNSEVMKALDRGRKVHDVITLPPSHFFITYKLALIKNGLIKKLIVSPMIRLAPDGFKAWDGLKIERIEFPYNEGIFRRDVLHPHRPHAAYLKSFIMKTQIVVANVIQMLKRHLFLNEIEFSVAMFKPAKRLNFEEALKDIQKKINQLWKFMIAHPGTMISIRCGFEDVRFCRESNKLETLRRCLSSEFVLEAGHHNVDCHLLKTKAMKTLEVIFMI